jgi:putative transposase
MRIPLIVIGATPEGKKELLGFQVGVRESAQSWRELLVELEARGLAFAPELATGDGALGFWKALEEVFPTTRHQRCTVHSQCARQAADLGAAGRQTGLAPDLDGTGSQGGGRSGDSVRREIRREIHERAVACLTKDRAVLLTFQPSTGTTYEPRPDRKRVRHRPASDCAHQRRAVAGHGSAMVFKLIMAAAKTWRRLKGENQC